MSHATLLLGLLTIIASLASAGAIQPAPRDLPAPLPPALPVVPGLNSDFLDDWSAEDFAAAAHDHDGRYFTEAESDARFAATVHDHDDRYFTEAEAGARFAAAMHDHDDRYYTEAETDARFLPAAGTAVDSDRLDGLDSSAFLRSAGGGLAGDLDVGGTVAAETLVLRDARIVLGRVVLGSFAILGTHILPDGAMDFDTVYSVPAGNSIQVAVRLINPGGNVTATISGIVDDELLLGVDDRSNTGGTRLAGGRFSGATFTILPGDHEYSFKAKNLGQYTILGIRGGWIPPGVGVGIPGNWHAP